MKNKVSSRTVEDSSKKGGDKMVGVMGANEMDEDRQNKKKFIPNVDVEIRKVENLKENVREKWKLGDTGIAFKIMTHNSPYEFRYEKIEGSFFDSVSKSLKSIDLSAFVKRSRGK